MDSNHFCEHQGCISPASLFYFKTNEQRKTCIQHQPVEGEKVFDIGQFHFITSPGDEGMYNERLEEVTKGREFIEKAYVQASEELEKALEDLEIGKKKAIHIVTEINDAEKRRTRQHFHQVEVFLEDFDSEFLLYLTEKENSLSDLTRGLLTGQLIPNILRTRVLDIDLELAQLIINSICRGETSLEQHLSIWFNPVKRSLVAAQLFQQAQKASDEFLEQQKALVKCEDSLNLRWKDEVVVLKAQITDRVEQKKKERATQVVELMTQDAATITSLLQIYNTNIEMQKKATNIQEVDRLFKQVIRFILPHSQSALAAATLFESSVWQCTQRQDLDNPKVALEKALQISSDHFPDSILRARVLYNLGVIYRDRQHYAEAEAMFVDASQIYQNTSPDALETARCLISLGSAQSKQDRSDEALVSLQAAKLISIPKFPTSLEAAQTLSALGSCFTKIMSYLEAEQSFHDAARILSTYFPTSSETAYNLAQLALLYERMKRYPDAEQCWKSGLSIYASYFPTASDTNKAFNSIALLFKTMNRFAEAEQWLKEALRICCADSPNSMEASITLALLAQVYSLTNREDEALKTMKKAADILTLNFPNSFETGKCLFALGGLYQINKMHTETEQTFKAAISILTVNSPTSIELGTSFLNLGLVLDMTNRVKEAEESYLEALRLLIRNFPTSIEAANALICLGGLYKFKDHREDEAEQRWREALSILKPNFPATINTAHTLRNLGALYKSKIRNAEAEECWKEAAAIYKPNFPTLFETASTFKDLGLLQMITRVTRVQKIVMHIAYDRNFRRVFGSLHLKGKQRKQESEKQLIKVAEPQLMFELNLEDHKSNFSKRTSMSMNLCIHENSRIIGDLYTSLTRYDDAEQSYREAQSLYDCYFPTAIETATTSISLGNIYCSTHRHPEAEQCWQAAIRMLTASFPISPELLSTLKALARLYETMERYQEAEQTWTKALNIYAANFPTCIDRANALTSLGLLYTAMNRFDEAQSSWNEAVVVYLANDNDFSEFVDDLIDQVRPIFENRKRRPEAEAILKTALETFDSDLKRPEEKRAARALLKVCSFFGKKKMVQELESFQAKLTS